LRTVAARTKLLPSSLPAERQRSSFVFEPDWRSRPWPPRGKLRPAATDQDLGLVGAAGTA
jgi:glutathione S-transferase